MTKDRKRNKVCGIAVNDVPGSIYDVMEDGSRKVNQYYKIWQAIIARCYGNPESAAKREGTVCEEWLTFSNFKSWMEQQDWEGKHLDKDIISYGGKHYSPDTCAFIDKTINSSFSNRDFCRRDTLTGAYSFVNGKGVTQYYGINSGHKKTFSTELEAHRFWQYHQILKLKSFLDPNLDYLIYRGIERVLTEIMEDYNNYRETKEFPWRN